MESSEKFNSRIASAAFGVVFTAVLMTSNDANAGFKDLLNGLQQEKGGAIAALIKDNCKSSSSTKRAICLALATKTWEVIERSLSQQDRDAHESVMAYSAGSGQAVNWTNPNTNVQIRTKVVSAPKKTQRTQSINVSPTVKVVPPKIQMVAKDYQADRSLSVYSGPGNQHDIAGQIAAGKTFKVVGKVTGTPWLLVSQDGVSTGYLSSNDGGFSPAQNVSPAPAKSPGVSGKKVAVATTTECKHVEKSVKLPNGTSGVKKQLMCLGPNGYKSV